MAVVVQNEDGSQEEVERSTALGMSVDLDDDDDGFDPETGREAPLEAPDAVEFAEDGSELPPEVDPIEGVLAYVQRLERKLNEATDSIARVRTAGDRAPALEDKPPKPLDQLQTAQDVVEYNRWERRQMERDIRQQASLDAQAVASEQRARGTLAETNMGKGYDYDSVVTRYVEPLMAANPATRQLFALQDDPAMAQYAFGLVLEILEKAKGDPVKTFKQVRSALGARTQAQAELVSRMRKAEDSGAARVRLRAGNTVTPADNGKLTARRLREMPLADFKKAMAERDRRMGM